jgi:hypothetical protein
MRIANVALFLVVLCASALAATRTPYTYHEDFTTRQFRDGSATTAAWDTVAASLYLAPPPGRLVGTWDSPRYAVGLEVDGDFLFLADQDAGVQILDVSQPANPQLLGNFNTTGAVWDVDAEGDWAFVADGSAGLLAINVTNPAAPVAGGVYNTPGIALAVEVVGDLAYVADGTAGLRVVFVKDPLAPFSVGTIATGGTAYDLDVEEDIAWVAANEVGLVAVNITNPAAPAVVSTLNTTGTAAGVAVDGDWAYVADGTNGLVIADVSDPVMPVIVATLGLVDRARDVAVDGDWVYVADTLGGMHVVDVHDPANPVLVDTQVPPVSARAIVVAGEYAYVADFTDGLRVLEISTRRQPLTTGTMVTTTHLATDLEIAGDYVYGTNTSNGITVFDASDPLAPVLLASCDTDQAMGLDLAGDHLYVADTYGGLKVVDVSDPAHPVSVGSYAGTGAYYDVTAVGDYLLVANQATGLTVLNITNPAVPTYVANLATHDWAFEIVVAGNVAYVADYRSGLTVVDISDPAHPALLANCAVAGNVSGLDVAGDYVYAAAQSGGLVVIDVQDPLHPAVVATCATDWSPRKVRILGDLAYVADPLDGIQIVDIHDPLAPVIVDTWDSPSYEYVVAVAGDVAFVGLDNPSGLQPLQVRDGRSPIIGDRARSLAVNVQAEDILKFRLATEQTDGFVWHLLAADPEGTPWQTVMPDGAWHLLDTPGDQLVWQATLNHVGDPSCTAVDLAWLSAAPVVGAVTDIPADQGGRVRVRFARSAFDFAAEATPITGYNLWRRVDDATLRGAVADAPGVSAEQAVFSDLTLREVSGRRFAADSRGLPPGTWESVGYASALQQDEYLVPASTLADSAQTIPWAVFCLTAHTATPSLWYTSPPDSGYSVDNIAPAIPAQLALAAGVLTWDPAPEPDFAYSTVYGSTVPYLDDTAVRLGYTITPSFDVTTQPYPNYLVTASDVAGNESDAAAVLTTTHVADVLPARTALLGAAPNPFNPATVIRYDLTQAGSATLRIYDPAGRLVRTLCDAAPRPAGRHEATWDGRTSSGGLAPTGVYCCRLTVGDYVGTVRLTLVK